MVKIKLINISPHRPKGMEIEVEENVVKDYIQTGEFEIDKNIQERSKEKKVITSEIIETKNMKGGSK